ncbi:MAG: hypothetical protein AB1498_12155 [bacterium]
MKLIKINYYIASFIFLILFLFYPKYLKTMIDFGKAEIEGEVIEIYKEPQVINNPPEPSTYFVAKIKVNRILPGYEGGMISEIEHVKEDGGEVILDIFHIGYKTELDQRTFLPDKIFIGTLSYSYREYHKIHSSQTVWSLELSKILNDSETEDYKKQEKERNK